MKKSHAEATTAKNLEEKFDRGEDVLDYFDAKKARLVKPQAERSVAKAKFGYPRKQIRIGALSFARSHRRIVKRDKERWESGLSRGGVSFFKDVTPGPPAERNPNAAPQFYRRCRENRLRTRRFSRRRLDFLRGLQLSRHCLDNPRIGHVEGAYVEKNNGPPDNGGKRSEQGPT